MEIELNTYLDENLGIKMKNIERIKDKV